MPRVYRDGPASSPRGASHDSAVHAVDAVEWIASNPHGMRHVILPAIGAALAQHEATNLHLSRVAAFYRHARASACGGAAMHDHAFRVHQFFSLLDSTSDRPVVASLGPCEVTAAQVRSSSSRAVVLLSVSVASSRSHVVGLRCRATSARARDT
jgi:hypothetical protein